MRHTAAQKMLVAVCHHPFGPIQMAFPHPPCAIGLLHRIDLQNDSRDLAPIGAFGFRVEKPKVADDVLLVIRCQRLGKRGSVGEFWGVMVSACRPVCHRSTQFRECFIAWKGCI